MARTARWIVEDNWEGVVVPNRREDGREAQHCCRKSCFHLSHRVRGKATCMEWLLALGESSWREVTEEHRGCQWGRQAQT